MNNTSSSSNKTHSTLVETLQALSLPRALQERIHISKTLTGPLRQSFVLYLPTVSLRSKHNPAFALACRFANHYQLPLLILGVVLDDFYHNTARFTSMVTVNTARKQTFTLQAFQKAASEWSSFGASVYIRVQSPHGGRTPHHISLATKAALVVTDEPFVYPYRGLVESVERINANVIRVDGSTTAPPLPKLTRTTTHNTFRGVPDKAWKWEKATSAMRRRHVIAVVEAKEFDAPQLRIRSNENDGILRTYLPKDWLDPKVAAPGKRAWTADEFQRIVPEEWIVEWPGVDLSVPTCTQTHGARGEERWASFRTRGLGSYAKRRNDARQPQAVSRMSCYLNMGTVSIFQIVYELWKDKRDTSKFEDEIIKWREIGYVHAFASPEYFRETAIPQWAKKWLSDSRSSGNFGYTLESLAKSQSDDATWNAMQKYLVETGELHNNVRMTWGKTLVEWQGPHLSVSELLEQMALLNDRYALDGLSPPSYAGLLWCLGWCDKPGPGGRISTKAASRYRVKPDGFQVAKERLYGDSRVVFLGGSSKRTQGEQQPKSNGKLKKPKVMNASITSYFDPANAKKIIG